MAGEEIRQTDFCIQFLLCHIPPALAIPLLTFVIKKRESSWGEGREWQLGPSGPDISIWVLANGRKERGPFAAR